MGWYQRRVHGESLLINHLKKMNSRTCYLFACLAAVLLSFTVDAGYVSKKAHRNCHTEYETVTSHENQSSTTYEQECSTLKEEHCKPKAEEECNTTHEKQCSTSHEEKCSTVYEDECSTSYEQK